MSSYEPLNHSDGEDEGDSVASSIEAPPFALDSHVPGHVDIAASSESNIIQPETIFVSTKSQLDSSHAMSSVTTEGQRSTFQSSTNSQMAPQQNRPAIAALHEATPRPSQHHDGGIQTYVFDGSGSLMGTSEPMLGSSHLPGSGMLWTHDSTTYTAGGGSLDFSQLMRQADNRNQSTIVQSRMSIVQESEEMTGLVDSGQAPTSTGSSNITPRTTNRSEHNWLYSLFVGGPSQHTLSAVPMMSLSPSHEDRSMSAGRSIQATRLGENTFQVSMQIDPPCTVRDVMDVVGNPDLLRLWCDPIRALVVTKSSEGAQSATNRGGNREYEGEWIEATTSTLVSPSKHSSCLYSLGQMIYTSLGFPNYGKITLFVERLRGQVGLTIGPFSGGIVASHTIKVQDDGPVVSVVDNVRLSRDEENCMCCCGLCEPIKRCFMPRMAGHVEQVLSSMMRLRVLVEHGETGTYAAHLGAGYDEEAASSMDIPLLS